MKVCRFAFTTVLLAVMGSGSIAFAQDENNTVAPPSSNVPVIPPAGSNGAAVAGPTTQTPNSETNALVGLRQPDPYFEPKGIPLGAPFRLFTNLFTSFNYDDNVFRQPGNVAGGKIDGLFFAINPSLILDYDVERARIDLYTDGSFNEYVNSKKVGAVTNVLANANTTNYDVGLRGTYEISHAATVQGNVSYSQLFEPFGSPNNVGFQSAPTQYALFDGSFRGTYKPNRLAITLGGSVDTYAYFSTPTFGGGTIFNRDRNNNLYKGLGELAYDFSPGYSAFLRATYNNDEFLHFPDTGVAPVNTPPNLIVDRARIHRSSHGYETDAGVRFLLGNLAQGEVYAGYLDQLYDKHQVNPLKNFDGLDFGADVTWYPTELLMLKLNASRSLQNTTIAGANTVDDRHVGLTAEYELTRRVHLNASATYDDSNFPGTVPTRDDKVPSFGVGAKWLISHYMFATANYTYSNRNSTAPGIGYADNLVTVGINLQI